MNDPTAWKGYWLKGMENLDAARGALDKKQYNVCASRAYYAVFLASIAALLKLTNVRAVDARWSHATVQAEVNRQFIVRRKILSSAIKRTSMDLIELRHTADYGQRSVSAREARRAVAGAQPFLSEIERILGKPNEK